MSRNPESDSPESDRVDALADEYGVSVADKTSLDKTSGNIHCRLSYTLHSGATNHDSRVRLELVVNGSIIGNLSLPPESEGNLTVDRTWFINPVLHSGANEFLIRGHVLGYVSSPFTSGAVEIFKDGQTFVRKDYYPAGTSFNNLITQVNDIIVVNYDA